MSAPVESNSSDKANKMDLQLNVENFPKCAVDTLDHIATLLAAGNNQNLVMQIIAKYIFLVQNKPSDRLNLLKELQLAIALVEGFLKPGRNRFASCNAIFMSLFGCHLTPERAQLLGKVLESLEMLGPVAPLLISAGLWPGRLRLVSLSKTNSQLHLFLLKTLQKYCTSGQISILNIQAFMQNFCARTTATGGDPKTNTFHQKCMERLAQAIRIAMYCKCIIATGAVAHTQAQECGHSSL
ncbi:uncharacterized protein LOC117581581 [Drosophila guanche]|uniref:Uncharacterized protein n=1 Tax=Drosophila guanche TaxID=7266 RepID=A0A3B0JE52_DROGU|nr:uncharacterized protein LOC117581581 [Drosophila guanche]SPP78442.1 Hypothetical predicted protein [Drosophila guanche]